MRAIKDCGGQRVFEFSKSELAQWGELERILEELGESGYELLRVEFSDGVRIFVRR